MPSEKERRVDNVEVIGPARTSQTQYQQGSLRDSLRANPTRLSSTSTTVVQSLVGMREREDEIQASNKKQFPQETTISTHRHPIQGGVLTAHSERGRVSIVLSQNSLSCTLAHMVPRTFYLT
ncbi:hypothetical protein CBL_01216 [Carabus blaptoides fortunei]